MTTPPPPPPATRRQHQCEAPLLQYRGAARRQHKRQAPLPCIGEYLPAANADGKRHPPPPTNASPLISTTATRRQNLATGTVHQPNSCHRCRRKRHWRTGCSPLERLAFSITPTPSNGLLLTTPEAVGWQGRQQTTPPHQCELPPAADACGMGHPTDKQRPPVVSASNRPQAKSMPSNTPVPTPAAACCETGWYTPPPRQVVAVR